MQGTRMWFGVLGIAVPCAFIACGDDAEDDGGAAKGGTSGKGGSTGGSPAGGKSGTTGTGGSKGGASGSNTGGDAGAGEGGEGGEAGGIGGDGGEAGTAQGGSAGGGAGGGMAGGGMAGALAGAGGATAGGGAGGAAGMAGGGTGGSAGFPTTCDPTPAPRLFVGELSGIKENPTNASNGLGHAVAELSPGETEVTVSVYWSYLTSNTTVGHIHGPAPAGTNADVQFDLTVPAGATSGQVVARTFPINATQATELKNGLYYANIHSTMFGDGELRAQLTPATIIRSGTLSGAQELPPNQSTATGRVVVAVFPSGNEAAVSATWSGLGSNTTTVRLHSPAGVGFITGPVFDFEAPTDATSGSVTHKIWTIYGSYYGHLIYDDTYAEVRTVDMGYGEIRAQLLPPCPP